MRRTIGRLVPVLLCVLLPLPGLAQAPVTSPPLVPAPSTPEVAPPESEQEDPYGGYDDEPEQEAPRGELIPREPSSPAAQGRVSRLVAESLLGLLLEVALGTPGAYLGFVAAAADDSSSGALGVAEIVGLTFVGVSLGASLGVTGGGMLTGGEGRFHVALLGAVIGTLAGGLVAVPVAFATGDGWIVPVLTLPVTGAIIAYEWSHGQELERKAAGGTALQVVPVLGVSRSGGLVAGLAGSF